MGFQARLAALLACGSCDHFKLASLAAAARTATAAARLVSLGSFQARLAALLACGSSAAARLVSLGSFQARLAALLACGPSAAARLALPSPLRHPWRRRRWRPRRRARAPAAGGR